MRRLFGPVPRLFVAAAVGIFCGLPVGWSAEKSSSYRAAVASIHGDQLQACVDFLADDKMEGREAGSRGGRKAGDYLAAELRGLGLAAAGDDDGYFQPFGSDYRNVLAKLEGSDPQLRLEYIVVGAHYDHVGYGNRYNSLGPIGQIHNGADDNASGTAGLVELAEAFTLLSERPKRSILFVGWDAEEKGLLGSKHWIAHPTVPVDDVAAMLNMDMIGRLRDDRLTIYGSRTGVGWRRLVSRENDGLGLVINFSWDMQPDADHYSFFDHRVPVIMAHTGLHSQYHRPTDDANLVNAKGIERVVRLMFGVAHELANQDALPRYREEARRESNGSRRWSTVLRWLPARRDRLGAGWNSGEVSDDGVRLTSVTSGSPADTAAIHAGDRVVEFAGRAIRSSDDLSAAVMSADSPAKVVVRRLGSDEPIEVSVALDGTPMRLGIRWRVDEAEPGTVILTEVVPASPAQRAGLVPGDHIYQVDGRDFADENEFAERVRTLPGPIEMTVERHGQIQTLRIRFDAEPLLRAA